MTNQSDKSRVVKQLTGKPGRPKGVEIKGAPRPEKGPTILSEHGVKGETQIKSVHIKEDDHEG